MMYLNIFISVEGESFSNYFINKFVIPNKQWSLFKFPKELKMLTHLRQYIIPHGQ